MRAAAYVIMLGLLLGSLATGQLGLALAAAGVKASIVGLEFMELRHAARAHATGFVLFVGAVTGILLAVT